MKFVGPVGPTDVLKMVEKSKFSATVHAQYMNSSLCLPLRVPKKKKKEENADAESTESKRSLGQILKRHFFSIKKQNDNLF